MHLEFNVGEGVEHSDALDGHVRDRLKNIERRFGDRITRIEVYYKDINADKGGIDKVCTLEARLGGLAPVAVEARHEDMYLAAQEAAQKLAKAIDHRLGKAKANHG